MIRRAALAPLARRGTVVPLRSTPRRGAPAPLRSPARRGALALLGSLLALGAQAETIAIVDAVAYPVSGTPIESATILIEDGRIAAIGRSVDVPAGARLIDAGGRKVTPGLMNAGTQLGLVEISSAEDTVDHRVATGPLGAAFDVQYGVNPNSTLLPIARADGVTRAAVVPTSTAGAPFNGMAAVLTLRESPEILARARAAMVATVGGWDASADRIGGSRAAQWLRLRNALDEAGHYDEHRREYETAAGRDQLLNRLDVEALQPVIAGDMPLVIAASRESDIREAVRLADDYDIRVIVAGGAEAWRAAEPLAEGEIPVILNPLDNLPRTFDVIGARLDNVAILVRAGVVVAFSLDGFQGSHNAGSAIRQAAGIAVANGLPRAEALRALTVNPARIWGIEDRYGTLEPGKDADLVIWNGDPLEPGTTAMQVFVQGEPVSMETRQTKLRERYHPRHYDAVWPPAYRR